MISLSKMLPLLAMMLIGDAGAVPAIFTTRAALKAAVRQCLSISPVGNCCAPENSVNSNNIVRGTSGDNGGECEDGYLHLFFPDTK